MGKTAEMVKTNCCTTLVPRVRVARIGARMGARTGAGYALLVAGCALTMTLGCNRPPGADVVATVNGKAIMRSDLDSQYDAFIRLQQQQVAPSQEQADLGRLKVVRDLIEEEIIEQRAAKMNLVATNEEVNAKLAVMKAPMTEEQFDEQLKADNQTLDSLRHDIRRSLTQEKLLNKEINSKITVSDGDIAANYGQHKADYNLVETRYRLAQIQVTDQPSDQRVNLQGSKATTDAEAKKKIDALKGRLDSGEDFGALAMNFSEDPATSSSGGDLGFVPESKLHGDPSIFNAITKLTPGHITDVLPLIDPQSKKPVGYVIVKLISKETPGQHDLGDPIVQQSIRQQLHNDRSQLLKNAYFEMLNDQAKVVNYFAEQIFKNDAK
jgi:peptidyl-prolyl cis-trans isomerase SurA